jgi:DNA-binding transcriptional ArsR family regulator
MVRGVQGKPQRHLDATALKALAHPLRVQILGVLRDEEQATATSLAARLSETTGATSYHLRQLARHGFIEEVPAAGRERWWRLAMSSIHMTGFEFLADPDTREAAAFLIREIVAERSRRMAHWFATATGWPPEWQAASSDADARLRLTPEQARGLADEIAELVDRYRLLSHSDAGQPVEIQYAVFPLEPVVPDE